MPLRARTMVVLYAIGMLTRSGVAKRLRCSLATVRRLEGRALFPLQDIRGVNWFDEGNIVEVAKHLRAGVLLSARGEWLSTRPESALGRKHSCERSAKAQAERQEVEHLRAANAQLKKELAEARQELVELCDELDVMLG